MEHSTLPIAPTTVWSPPAASVSNSAFLTALFPPDLVGDAHLWVTAFAGDPSEGTEGIWRGYPIRAVNGAWPAPEMAGHNTFYTISSFRPRKLDDGRVILTRSKATHVGTFAIVIDDVGDGPGGKLNWADLQGGPMPSYILETSPRSCQVGYALSVPVTERESVDAFVDALLEQTFHGAADPGMRGVTRNVRLPVGSNGKKKYGETPFAHRLLHWDPARRYTLQELTEAFCLVEGVGRHRREASERRASAVALEGDLWWSAVREATEVLGPPREAHEGGQKVDILCPWVDEHTGGVTTGSAWFAGGGFKCHHGHCEGRTGWDVKRWLLLGGNEPEGPRRDRVTRLALDAVGQEYFADVLAMPYGAETAQEPSPPIVPVRWDYDGLALRIDRDFAGQSGAAALTQADTLVRDIARAGLGTLHEGVLLESLADRAALKLGNLKEVLKREKARAGREAKAQAGKTGGGEGRGGLPKGHALVLPGEWPHADDDDNPLFMTGNLERMLQGVDCEVRLNEMTGRVEYGGAFARASTDWMLQYLEDSLRLQRCTAVNKQGLVTMLRKLAEEQAYHPFEQFLDSVVDAWDGHDRLSELRETVLVEAEHEELRDVVLKRWLYSIVAAARWLYRDEPGAQPRGVLVLIGRQYLGKTTWLARLFSGLFPRSHTCFLQGAHYDGSTDSQINLLGALCVELGEIDSTMNRAEAGMLKAFLSNDTTRLRRPYGYDHIEIPRRTVFSGTVNREDFLRDETGGSRFWVLPVRELDLDRQKEIDMRQVWAQVDHECRADADLRLQQGNPIRPWLMDRAEMDRIENSNEAFLVRTEADTLLEDAFQWDHPDWLRAETLAQRLQINPRKLSEVSELCTGMKGYSRRSSFWEYAIRRKTGQRRGVMTRVTLDLGPVLAPDGKPVTGPDGKPLHNLEVRRGRLWALPPLSEPYRMKIAARNVDEAGKTH